MLYRRHHPASLVSRVDASVPITGDLLAAASGQPLELARRLVPAWFELVRSAAQTNVIVFDEFVVGPPCPLLLEAADQLRAVRRAENLGQFDHEESEWYDEHCDDEDADWEEPTPVGRVLVAMECQQESDHLRPGPLAVWPSLRAAFGTRSGVMPLIILEQTLARIITEISEGVRIGDAIVIDGRLSGEQADGLRWAA